MLTKITVENFKLFYKVEVELGNPVVLIGPNNSGKTSALQALALWDVGLKRWNEKRKGKKAPEKRPGVTINRKDPISIPVPSANLVKGSSDSRVWECGLEFDYANEESLHCRPLRRTEGKNPERMPVSPKYPTPSELAAQTTKSLHKILARSPNQGRQDKHNPALVS